MKKFYYFLAFAMLFLSVSAQNATRGSQATEAVTMEYVSTKQVEAHATYHRVNITLNNRYDHPVWFIIPSFGEDKVANDGRITAVKPWKHNFITAKTYVDQNAYNKDKTIKRVIRIHFIGDKMGFYAFRMPAKGSITIKNHDIGTYKDATSVQVFQTEAIKVNGLLPLEKYVLYETECTSGAEIDIVGSYWLNVDWAEKDLINEWGNMQVDYLKVAPLSISEVKIK